MMYKVYYQGYVCSCSRAAASLGPPNRPWSLGTKE